MGVALGFALTVRHSSADACSCAGFETWTLKLVETSPGLDRAAWDFNDTYLNRSDDRRHTIHSVDRYELEMELK
ncbi:MAG TPA: hypothetical protein VIV11_36835 [Kofleriaceae bacterium]